MTPTPLPAAFFLPVGAAQLPGGMSAGAFYSARLLLGTGIVASPKFSRSASRGAHEGNLVTLDGKSGNSGHRGRERGQPRAATIQHPAGSPRQSAGAMNRKSGFDLVGTSTGAHQTALRLTSTVGDC